MLKLFLIVSFGIFFKCFQKKIGTNTNANANLSNTNKDSFVDSIPTLVKRKVNPQKRVITTINPSAFVCFIRLSKIKNLI